MKTTEERVEALEKRVGEVERAVMMLVDFVEHPEQVVRVQVHAHGLPSAESVRKALEVDLRPKVVDVMRGRKKKCSET